MARAVVGARRGDGPDGLGFLSQVHYDVSAQDLGACNASSSCRCRLRRHLQAPEINRTKLAAGSSGQCRGPRDSFAGTRAGEGFEE